MLIQLAISERLPTCALDVVRSPLGTCKNLFYSSCGSTCSHNFVSPGHTLRENVQHLQSSNTLVGCKNWERFAVDHRSRGSFAYS